MAINVSGNEYDGMAMNATVTVGKKMNSKDDMILSILLQ